MADNFHAALDLAAAQFTPTAWARMAPRERSACIYQALCRIDSGCRRSDGPGDAALPPCPASALHIATRGCLFAGGAARLTGAEAAAPALLPSTPRAFAFC